MKKKSAQPPEVVWQEERETLTLEGEPVLEYSLSWPEVRGGGLGCRFITRYYARLAQNWRLRWRREVYILACLALAERRAASRLFSPWSGKLTGEVTKLEGGLLSLRLLGEGDQGDGRPCRVRWGDVWKLREGAPSPLKEHFPGKRGWKKALTAQVVRQGNDRRAAGDCFLDPDWEKRLAGLKPFWGYCLTDQGVELAFPQCALAPAAEGTPVFWAALPERPDRPNPSGKNRGKKRAEKIENYP